MTNSALLDLLQLAATYSTVPFHVSTPIGAASIHVPGMASAGVIPKSILNSHDGWCTARRYQYSSTSTRALYSSMIHDHTGPGQLVRCGGTVDLWGKGGEATPREIRA